jgi:hypothetical protein
MNDLEQRRILVVEDEIFVALDEVDAAILDVNLADGNVEPILDRLKSRNTFVVIHTGGGLPAELAARYPEVPVFQKPIPPIILTRTLATALSAVAVR